MSAPAAFNSSQDSCKVLICQGPAFIPFLGLWTDHKRWDAQDYHMPLRSARARREGIVLNLSPELRLHVGQIFVYATAMNGHQHRRYMFRKSLLTCSALCAKVQQGVFQRCWLAKGFNNDNLDLCTVKNPFQLILWGFCRSPNSALGNLRLARLRCLLYGGKPFEWLRPFDMASAASRMTGWLGRP